MNPTNQPEARPESLEAQLRSMIISNATPYPNPTAGQAPGDMQYHPHTVGAASQSFTEESGLLPHQLGPGPLPQQNHQGSYRRHNGRVGYSTHANLTQGHYSNQRPVHSSHPYTNRAFDPPPSYQRSQHPVPAGYQRYANPNSYQQPFPRPAPPQAHDGKKLFNPNSPASLHPNYPPPWQRIQAAYLQDKADQEVRLVEISESERRQKETFLTKLQGLCEILCEANPSLPKVTLECFGSFKSGFASAGSDMDVAIVLKGNLSESTYISLDEAGLPRSLEKMLLENAIGARLLDKTRVPIIQVCEAPDDETLAKLTQNRKDWEDSPVEHKYPHLFKDGKKQDDQDEIVADAHELKSTSKNEQAPEQFPAEIPNERIHMEQSGKDSVPRTNSASPTIQKNKPIIDPVSENGGESTNTEKEAQSQPKRERPWTRERKKATMDFPKEGVGIQCDINFFNPLGIHNTKLLRCYSSCDPRVRPMILFIKAWAKRRKINSSYSGTLSSYGYVLMVLHYLVNITKPPVLPNLQRQLQVGSTFFEPGRAPVQVGEWVVDFCQDEIALLEAARSGQLTKSNEPLGSLLAGFFHYYAAQGGWRPDQSFFWKDSVLSLRSPGGILSKEDKGWTRLVTEEVDGKEVRHRYLFAIEDPFELRHNVARTVGHQGIVAVRDEFRRAHRILLDAGNSRPLRDGELLDPFVDPEELPESVKEGRDAAVEQPAVQTIVNQAQDSTPNGLTNTPSRYGNPPRQAGYGRGHYAYPVAAPPYSSKPKPSPFDINDSSAFPAIGAKKPSTK